jgi:hypothetical protein
MTVRTPNITFIDLGLDSIPTPSTLNSHRYRYFFNTPDVIKVKNANITFTAVNTRMGFKIFPNHPKC